MGQSDKVLHMRKPYIHSTQREGLSAWGNNNESVKNERHAHGEAL